MLGIDFAVVFGRGASWRGVFACGRGGMQSSGNIEGAFARYGCCLLDVLLCLPPIGARKSQHAGACYRTFLWFPQEESANHGVVERLICCLFLGASVEGRHSRKPNKQFHNTRTPLQCCRTNARLPVRSLSAHALHGARYDVRVLKPSVTF